MEEFWPGMDAKSARRNLYQAVYNLRQALQSHQEDASYVLTEDNHYCLSPELEIWVDSEAFNSHYQNALSLLGAGHQKQAIQELEAAENLYQGEFLAEDRYEDWPLVNRENLKNAYLDTLGQLSQHYYTSGQFAMSIYYCHKILGEDQCREDVHRRVMLCYLNLDQPHLALRQYHTCVEALKEELDVPPMPATEELLKNIQQRRQK
jgi:DNA-binding SARP family transcriptional activator